LVAWRRPQEQANPSSPSISEIEKEEKRFSSIIGGQSSSMAGNPGFRTFYH